MPGERWGPEFKAPVDRRFGRGAYFIVLDSDTQQWQAHKNEGVNAAAGAGARAAQFATQQSADVIISGGFGLNAYLALAAAEIKMYLLGPSQTAEETWRSTRAQEHIQLILTDEPTRLAYD